ncbi:prolyl-tRNA synthetase [Chryseobacterium arthrosphaerae]|uniref:prolyl-tRNA synthetase n=1 Tax=Chryseobacterium arthrosphaerae TaxID=651561 RepID=UPI0023E2E024|nr:prolyl-tRNA synthetase [Chryseobacterium arthrosphaerae]WES97831.1 prolyl-tRNA synthetase [Chryseobacterium arthrosphaerae]
MKRNIHKNLLGLLKSKGVLAISGGLLLVSCGAQMGGYSETDGVYYDPNKDTLPEGVIINDSGNRVGEYYDYYQDSNVIQNAEANSREQQNRYNEWSGTNPNWGSNATDSDWGMYAGSQTNYYDNSWGWGSPWGWYGGYSPYWGWNRGWGWGGSLSWGWGGSFGWGWGGSFGWGSPYWGYSPYWGGYYDPFWGGYYGSPWGYGGYWGGGYYAPVYRRSGASGRGFVNPGIGNAVYRTNTANSGFRNNNGFRDTNNGGFRNGNSGGFRNSNSNGGFRNGNSGGFRQQGNTGGFRSGNSGGFRNTQSNGGFRNSVPQSRPDYQQPSQPRYNNGGFRSNDSGGFRSSGGFNSGGGGFRGGSGGGGGFRSGGGGRGGFR